MRNMNSIINIPLVSKEVLRDIIEEFRDSFLGHSLEAEKYLSGKQVIFAKHGKELYPYCAWEDDATTVPGCIISIEEGRQVASVDSSCIILGETNCGSIYAVRAGVGISFLGAIRRYIRIGPLILYLSEDGMIGLRGEFNRIELSNMLSDHLIAERTIRNFVERKLIESLLNSNESLIVIADGSLKHPLSNLSSLSSKLNNNKCLIGFSKSSSLVISERLGFSISSAKLPVYCTIDDGPVKTVLAKFSPNGLIFRVDIASKDEPVDRVLGLILCNDSFTLGYPESLKIAHHLSTFTSSEDAALKAYVKRRYKLRQIPAFDLRRAALGTMRGK